MITYRFQDVNGRWYEARINRINNALPEINKRIQYCMEKTNEKRGFNVQPVPGRHREMV